MVQAKYKPIRNKRSTWPVFYREGPEGTVYLPQNEMSKAIERHGYTGQAWEFRRLWKTYRPGGGVVYKSLDSLSPTDEPDFWHVMQSNFLQGLPPPSSFGSIFHRLCALPWPRKGVIAPFRGISCGAWSQALQRGTFREKVYHYDLNSAYRWAGCQGLPLLKSGKRVFDIEADKAVFLVEFTEGNRPPWGHETIGMISSEEVRALKIHPRVIFGVQFRDWLDLSPVFEKIDQKFPWCYKRISRAFWGRWNGETEVMQHGWKNGHKVRAMKNPLHNPLWAHLITSRVKLRLHDVQQQQGGLHVQVDAVLCRDPLPVSQDVGAWKLVQEYPGGIWIHGTGQWGYGKFVVKRMGMQPREAEQWVRHLT